jgi:DNA-binding NtrC family response regulator
MKREINKILIVDDEPNMRLTLSDIMIDEGYEVQTAASGEEAVRLCENNNYDIVLMDVRMPGIDGVEAFKAIRRHKEGVKVILMSAYTVDDLKHAALDDGAIAFLSKPLDMQKTIQLISEVKETAILVVEEDENISNPLVAKLKDEGYRVTSTKSPHNALELVEQIKFDLVFVDVNLPSMNGLDLYLAIKKITPSSIAIMITGMEDEFIEIAREAVSKNAYTFLKKPLEIDYTLELLERLTQKRASGDSRKPNSN